MSQSGHLRDIRPSVCSSTNVQKLDFNMFQDGVSNLHKAGAAQTRALHSTNFTTWRTEETGPAVTCRLCSIEKSRRQDISHIFHSMMSATCKTCVFAIVSADIPSEVQAI